jgi:hypothetical protein
MSEHDENEEDAQAYGGNREGKRSGAFRPERV